MNDKIPDHMLPKYLRGRPSPSIERSGNGPRREYTPDTHGTSLSGEPMPSIFEPARPARSTVR